jgi:hypothetical protein
VFIALILYGRLRDDVWSYFTDDAGLRVEVQDHKARGVLWQDPKQSLFDEERVAGAPAVLDPVNRGTGKMAAAFSPDGTRMILTRWSGDLEMDRTRRELQQASTHADLYQSSWDGRRWTRPVPLSDLNSPSNEQGAAFSRDGRYLYFASDREGGHGGYDLYIARWNGRRWAGIEPLGDSINTAADETGPALAADGKRLYFSSGTGEAEDIYVSTVTVEAAPDHVDDSTRENKKPGQKRPRGERRKQNPKVVIRIERPEPALVPLAPIPTFAQAQPVDELNSSADDVNAALTGRGDHVFLASDRDRDEATGFGLYISRVIGGKVRAPQPLDLYIENGNTTAPLVRMQGFDLLFSGDHEKKIARTDADPSTNAADYKLYRSTTREVIGYTDTTRWTMFKKFLWDILAWLLGALTAIVGLIYILEKWRDITSLYHKCLAGSVAVHLVILLLFVIWRLTEMTGAEPRSPEIMIKMDALAQEQLALESDPDVVEVADSSASVISKLKSDFKIPVSKPIQNAKTTTILTSTAKVSLVQDVRPSRVNDSQEVVVPRERERLESELLSELPKIHLPTLEVETLEEARFVEKEKPVDTAKDVFTPDIQVVQKVETKKSKQQEIHQTEAKRESTASDAVAKSQVSVATRDTGGELVLAKSGLEAIGELPELDGVSNEVALLTGQKGIDNRDNPALPGKLSVPENMKLDGRALSKFVQKQRGVPALEIIEQFGGSDATEKAIGRGLEWLTGAQEPDGRWDATKHGSRRAGVDTGATGFALLCYYGWGVKHNAKGHYAEPTRKAIEWLIKQQKADGDLRGGGDMYCHGIASIALCEAYGITKDPKLRLPAEKAIRFILTAQDEKLGGWRYQPGRGSDTSVTGWQFMAMHSARMADLQVPDDRFTMVGRWLDSVASGSQKGLYGYTGGRDVRPAMVATGMFCRQLDLVPPTDRRMQESAEYLKNNSVARHKDYYYIYYGTLALYQHQGAIWEKWNEEMKEFVLLMQKKDGADKGSWDPGRGHGATGGRVVSTTMAILSLEVYYRLLPMYGFRDNGEK